MPVERPPDQPVIEEYVRVLGRRLSGTGRLKADLLAEARDGLIDAAEAYREQGLSPAAAQVRAVAEFGPIRRVLPDYQAELAVSAARRVALLLATVPVTLGSLSTLMWHGAPWTRGPIDPNPAYSLVALVVDRLGAVLAVAGLAAFLGLTVGARRWPVRRRVARAVAIGGLLGLVVLYSGGLAIYLMSLHEFGAAMLAWTPTWLGAVTVLAGYAWLGRNVRRALIASRPPARDGPGPVP